MTAAILSQAFALVFDPYVLWVILASALFGLFVGAVPGLTATMATALLVPITFFIPPVPAVAAIVSCTAMAIFAGDIPGALLRIPGTPASAAYTDEAYAMTRKGQAELALGAGLVFSAIGGLFGTAVLIAAAPTLAEVALKFSSFEYFWLVVLGLSSAVFIGSSSKLKAMTALMIGLLVACVGLDNPGAHPRFTFGNVELMGGVSLIPMMVGMFAISEILRYVTSLHPPAQFAVEKIGNVFRGMWDLTRRYKWQIVRGSAVGTAIGIQPGAGADIAVVDHLCDEQALLEGAREVRHRSRRRDHRIGRREQLRTRRRVGAGARLRDSRRLHHGDRDRRAVPEEHEPGADDLHQQSAEHLRDLHRVHSRQPDHAAARLAGDQDGEEPAARAAEDPHARDPAVLRRRRVRDQQHASSAWC